MKKILLGTTTLAALVSSAAFAGETPKVTLGGFSDFQVGIVGEDQDANKRAGAFRSDNEVTLRIDGKTDAGLGYGGGINLEADTTDDADSQGTNASRTFVYLDGMWGRLQGGSDLGVTNTMKIDASSIARATGGIDGDFTYFMTATSGNVIATPDLDLDYGAGQLGDESTENLNKISYYTPRFAGFQAGISYLFDNTSRGQTVNRFDDGASHTVGGSSVTASAENIFLGAVNWEGKFDQVGLSAGGTGEWGNATLSTNNDLRTWQLGAKATYMGFALAGSYGNYGDSLQAKTTASDSSTYFWTVGAAYEMGAFGASVTYLNSQRDVSATTHNDFSNISVGADYKLAPGFTPYAEVNFIQLDPTSTAEDNDATVFIAGTQLAF